MTKNVIDTQSQCHDFRQSPLAYGSTSITYVNSKRIICTCFALLIVMAYAGCTKSTTRHLMDENADVAEAEYAEYDCYHNAHHDIIELISNLFFWRHGDVVGFFGEMHPIEEDEPIGNPVTMPYKSYIDGSDLTITIDSKGLVRLVKSVVYGMPPGTAVTTSDPVLLCDLYSYLCRVHGDCESS